MVAAHIQVEEIGQEAVMVAGKETEENHLEAHLLQEEKVQEALALLKENLMLLQKEKEATKLFSFLQQNLSNSKAQNKQHLQSLYS